MGNSVARGIGRVSVAFLASAALIACGSGEAGRDSGPPHDSSLPDDSGPPHDSAGDQADANTDSCDCPDDEQVEMFHACTPPLRAGCRATVCEPGVTDCGAGYSCEECSAAACCICAACLPSCVFTGPAQGPLPEYLKLHQVYGPPDQEREIVVEGYPFYIGALFYLARVGDSSDLMESSYPGTCSHGFTAPAHAAGTEPVWVSQYGGEDPWVLAGFFTYTSGAPPLCVQPGFSCDASGSPCCETTEVPMACVAGRCRME